MPGHKRNASIDPMFEKDFTEVRGLDDLHHPEEMILSSMNELSKVYGTYRSYYLVNGSTGGLLAAVMACAKKNKTEEKAPGLLVAANCHKSVFNGAELTKAPYEIFHPMQDEVTGIYESIDPTALGKYLEKKKKEGILYSAFVMTSPTYEGIISDTSAVKKVLTEYNMKLIVDEAHGAHLPFSDRFGVSAIKGNADIVVESLHKTLPSLTQTAVLHIVSEDEALKEKVEKYLSVFQSSSPSYIFLAGMEKCVALCDEKRSEFDAFYDRVMSFREGFEAEGVKHIKLLSGTDPSRLTFLVEGMSGRDAALYLEERYKVVMEMSGRCHMVAIATVMDSEAAFDTLLGAIEGLDGYIESKAPGVGSSIGGNYFEDIFILTETGKCPLSESEGKKSENAVYVYPPGIPVIHAGDIIEKNMLSELEKELACGAKLRMHMQRSILLSMYSGKGMTDIIW